MIGPCQQCRTAYEEWSSLLLESELSPGTSLTLKVECLHGSLERNASWMRSVLSTPGQEPTSIRSLLRTFSASGHLTSTMTSDSPTARSPNSPSATRAA